MFNSQIAMSGKRFSFTDWLVAVVMAVSVSLGFVSCDKDSSSSASDIVMLVDLEGNTIVQSGTHVQINIAIMSAGSGTKSLEGESFDKYNGTTKLFTATSEEVGNKYSYDWTVPYVDSDSVPIKLSFTLTDNDGHKNSIKRTVIVSGGDYMLKEMSGISLYATDRFNRPNALYLNPLRLQILSMADTVPVDIYSVDTLKDSSSDVMTRIWQSSTGLLFARVNSFDYANASQMTVSATWKSILALPRIADIKDDDVIFVGSVKDGCKAVIKVVCVIDQDGAENDRYLISVKSVREKDQSDSTTDAESED